MQASSLKTKEELVGRLIHEGDGEYIIAAWVASSDKAKEIGRTGCAMVWPSGEWRWLEDLTVSGSKAALLPRLSKKQLKAVRKSLALFIAPYGSDAWVARQCGYAYKSTVRDLRIRNGIAKYDKHLVKVSKEQEIRIAKMFLSRYSYRRIARETGMSYFAIDKVLSSLKAWPASEPRVRVTKRVQANIKKKYNVELR